MANICDFKMQLIGEKGALNVFLEVLARPEAHRLQSYVVTGRGIFDKNIEVLTIEGTCDWNLGKSMLLESAAPNSIRLNLNQMSEQHHLSIRVFTYDDCNDFQEHFYAVNGEVLDHSSSDIYRLDLDVESEENIKDFLNSHPDFGVTFDNYEDFISEANYLVLGGYDNYGHFDLGNDIKTYLDYNNVIQQDNAPLHKLDSLIDEIHLTKSELERSVDLMEYKEQERM